MPVLGARSDPPHRLPATPGADAAAWYDARIAHHTATHDRERRTADRLSAARLVVALALVTGVAAALGGALSAPAAGTSSLVLVVAFVALALVHRRVQARAADAAARVDVSARGARRVRREWQALPVPAWPSTSAPIVEDLDLVGRPSLAQLLDVVTPAIGAPRLLGWLLADPPAAAVVESRQQAAAEAARRPEFLESCAVGALAARTVAAGALDTFLHWAEDGHPTGRSPTTILAAARRAVPLLTAGMIAILAFGVAGRGATTMLALCLALNLVVAGAAHRRLRALLAGMGDLPALLGPALRLMRRFDTEPLDAPAWGALRAHWRAGQGLAAMRALERLLAWGEIRYSPMGHWLLNALVAYDAQLLAALERWRRGAGTTTRAWYDALGEAEALAALATLAHDNPDWTWPALADDDPGAPALDAGHLAHPLLPAAGRVGNDLHLEGPGSVLVVTGSNMAGKTTLLRAIALNVLLAQAGGPVCAGAMRWQRARVRTSVRVRDALGEGVSLYLAELRRLKSVVDDATGSDDGAGVAVLYLFDEILHGTNGGDRRTATRAVLRRLSAAGAFGVVTTHDLELADEPPLALHTQHLHFREHYEQSASGPRMRFDYVARPGKATSANALALLALLGLDVGTPDPCADGLRSHAQA